MQTTRTEQQSEASRVNGSQSHGPVSDAGKARSSRNALKSGLYAKSLIIAGENLADLEALTAEYLAEYQPAAPAERYQVDIMIRSEWQLRRLAVTETKLWNARIDNVYRPTEAVTRGVAFSEGSLAFIRLRRITDATERSYQAALRELERLQSARRDSEAEAQEMETNLSPASGPRPQAPEAAPDAVGFVPSDARQPTKETPPFHSPAPGPRPQTPENPPAAPLQALS